MTDDVFAWLRWLVSGAATVVVALLGLTWKGLNTRVDAIQAAAASNAAAALLHAERITRTEERVLTHMEADQRTMEHIDKRLDRIEAKLDAFQKVVT